MRECTREFLLWSFFIGWSELKSMKSSLSKWECKAKAKSLNSKENLPISNGKWLVGFFPSSFQVVFISNLLRSFSIKPCLYWYIFLQMNKRVLFSLYKICIKGKYVDRNKVSGCLGLDWEQGLSANEHKRSFWSYRNVLICELWWRLNNFINLLNAWLYL